jgi:hypothetical protein
MARQRIVSMVCGAARSTRRYEEPMQRHFWTRPLFVSSDADVRMGMKPQPCWRASKRDQEASTSVPEESVFNVHMHIGAHNSTFLADPRIHYPTDREPLYAKDPFPIRW